MYMKKIKHEASWRKGISEKKSLLRLHP